MPERCLICLGAEGVPEGEIHPACARRLFRSKSAPKIEVDPANLHLLGLEMAGRVSLSGVQRKISLGGGRGTLRVVADSSAFILKPASGEYPSLAENEHVTLRIAALVGLETPPSGLVRLRDDSLALLIRRFDRTEAGGRIAMEDFCQLAERAPSEKYGGSAELCLRLLRRYSSQPLVDAQTLYRQFLFSWWMGNDDLHLKNLSLLTSEIGRPKLSPVYDLVNTSIVIPDGEMAMTIGGKRKRLDAGDWLALAEYARLNPEVVAAEAVRLVEAASPAIDLVRRSFLRSDLKSAYELKLVEGIPLLVSLRDRARGVSTKKATERLEPRVVRPSTIARTVQIVRTSFQEESVDLAGSAIERDLSEIEWLAAAEDGIVERVSTDRRRAAGALVQFARYDRLRKAMTRCSSFPGYAKLMRHLRTLRLPKDARGESQAWNRLFELECAAQLAQPFWRPAFEEPDIVLHGEDRVGVACKRPASAGSLARNVREACTQIAAAGLPGFVAVNVELLFDSLLITTERPDRFPKAAEDELARLVEPSRSGIVEVLPRCTIEKAPTEGVLGVIFCATFLTLSDWSEELCYLNSHLAAVAVPNPALMELAELLEFFTNALKVGQAELRQQP